MCSESRGVPDTTHASEADRLVVDQVQPRGPAAPTEVLRVGPGVHAADGHDEADAIDGGDQPAAPCLGQADAGLGVDQGRIGCREVLGPQVGLLDVADPTPSERLDARGDDGPVPDVERLCGQSRGDADVEVRQPALAARHSGERLQEPWLPGHHLQDQLADVDLGHHGLAPGAQVGEARRVGDGVDLGGVQPTLGVDTDLVGLHPPGDVAQSAVQGTGLVLEEGVRGVG